jgi:hypothetical protein
VAQFSLQVHRVALSSSVGIHSSYALWRSIKWPECQGPD